MANIDTPFGFKPVKNLNGAPWNGKANVYYIPSTDNVATFIGDAVKSAGSADDTGKYPTVTQATAGAAVRGVVIGFGDNPYTMTHPDTPNRNYRPAATAMYAFVVDDPQVIFEVQEDSDANSITAAMVGLSTNFIVGSGSTTTGKSAMELDSSDTATDTAGNCRILRLANREDNELGNYAKWEVLFGEHELGLTISTDV
jgi:hypothetical protein